MVYNTFELADIIHGKLFCRLVSEHLLLRNPMPFPLVFRPTWGYSQKEPTASVWPHDQHASVFAAEMESRQRWVRYRSLSYPLADGKQAAAR